MAFKKIIAAILVGVMLFSAVGCSSDGDGTDITSSVQSGNAETTEKSLSLLYSSSDSLDPYKAQTLLNRQLSLLMYDPLVKLDSKFQPHFCLAKSVEIDGQTCIITLNKATFSDGSAVTAEDVVYSLKVALKAELTAYPEQLSSIKKYSVEEDGTVKLTLSKTDPYFANLLDFPIIKKDSDEIKDENNILLPPIGSGRYVFDTEEKLLTANRHHISGAPSVTTVKLVNAPDSAVEKYNLEAGNVSLYYTDLSDGIIPPMSGNSCKVHLQNLVYMGVNLKNTHLKDARMRYALASAVDRTAIAKEAYYEYATPALGLFNSAWSDAGSLQNLTNSADLQNVVAIFKDIGYNSKDEEGFFVNSKGKAITFKLVAFKGNARRAAAAELVKQQLETAGIKVKLSLLDWDAYVKALQNGDFDLYIAEVKLPDNMDVGALVTSNGALSYGIPNVTESDQTNKTDKNDKEQNTDNKDKTEGDKTESDNGSSVPLLDGVVNAFYSGTASLVDIINAFNAEMPLIPLCHRQGLTVGAPDINVNDMSSVSDVYFGLANIK